MSDKVVEEKRLRIWRSETEFPPEVFEVWHKPGGAISPVAIVATVDPDGMPHTAPFGSLRAITPGCCGCSPGVNMTPTTISAAMDGYRWHWSLQTSP
jgi:hypothetical protein